MNRGRRGSALGLHTAANRIRGGFQASMLPGTSNSSLRPSTEAGTSQTSNGGGNQMIIIGSTSSVQSQQQCSGTMSVDADGSGDIRSTVNSILSMSKGLGDQMNRIEQRMLGIKKKQDKASDILKEISDLMKNLNNDSFSTKGSPYEVYNI